MIVDQHPAFATWLRSFSEDFDLYGELYALINALEREGRDLFGTDECHPVVTSPFLYALRRTPPTMTTPYASAPPVIRMLFALTTNPNDPVEEPTAVLLHGGDKTHLGNHWYPPNIATAHSRLRMYSTAKHRHPKPERRTR